MEEKLRHAFDTLHMPEACANRIEEELCKPAIEKKGYCAEPVQPARSGWVKSLAAAAALLAVAVAAGSFLSSGGDTRLSSGETVTGSAEETLGMEAAREDLDAIKQELEALKERLACADADFRFDQYYVVGEDGKVYCRYEYVAQAKVAPDWLIDEDGRLYFVGSGEKIDITDEISLEEPYIYIYTDENNTKRAIIVGRTSPGPYADIGNSVGWITFDWEEGAENWTGGGGTHWSNWMNCEWPWLTKAKQELDIPWSSSEPETTAVPEHDHQDSHEHH